LRRGKFALKIPSIENKKNKCGISGPIGPKLEKNTFLWYPAFLKFAFETQQRYSF
jgi:hypothetical protein